MLERAAIKQIQFSIPTSEWINQTEDIQFGLMNSWIGMELKLSLI